MARAAHGLASYLLPPRTRNAAGRVRCVGIEIELGNLSLERTLEVMQGVLGGQVSQRSAAQASLETKLGKFRVELDSPALKDRSYLRPLERLGVDLESETAQLLEGSLLRLARTLVPVEIVSPPIPWDGLAELDPLFQALQLAGAEGTSTSVLHAFGLHLNPEPADFELGTVLGILRSFLLLEDWIVESARIDISRRIAPFINPFPEAYRRQVLQLSYAPDFHDFVEDYVEHNPTRNRPLDLLPLLVHLGAGDLAERVENWPLVKGRPTFHYRLPDCHVSDSGWSPAIDLNRWVVIERLAEQGELLDELCAAYLQTDNLLLRWQSLPWVTHVQGRLKPLVEDVELSRA